MLIENIRRHVGWLYRMRSIYLLASLILFVLLVPRIGNDAEFQDKILGNLLNMFILVAAVAAVGRTRLSFVVAVMFTLPVLGFQIAGLAFGDEDYLLWSWMFGATFYATTLVYLLRYVFSSDVMDADKLFGAAAAYMLLGMLWAYFYLISQYLNVNAFAVYGEVAAAMTSSDMIYFSYTTLTSTGFGDIAPLHPRTRALANLEQVCGTLFVAILIARLAGIYPEPAGKRR
jgi:Ion channel